MGEERRQEMMQNLFGDDQSDDEMDSEQEIPRHSGYVSDEGEAEGGEGEEGMEELEGEGGVEYEGTAEVEGEGEGEGEAEGDVEIESEGERAESEHDREESEGERSISSPEREISAQRESEAREVESDAEGYGTREATSRRQVISPSTSEQSHQNKDMEDDEVEQVRDYGEHDIDHNVTRSADMHDVFGYSDEEQPEYEAHHSPIDRAERDGSEEVGSEQRGLQPEDIVPDEDDRYDSDEDQQYEQRQKEKPIGQPLDLEFPIRPPPGPSDKMNIVRVSNIMGIEPKPFDPKDFVEEELFETDESGSKKRIRLEDNIVRWRKVQNRDGKMSYESNARFVRWSDGSMQLLIGNEVLDLSVQDARHDQLHLFLRHGKGILQSQGRLLHKMKFMPSSLTSKSHKMLTALVDSHHKKSYKVKNVITNTDPEREKEEKEKAHEQRIRSREDLHRKQDRISRKYVPPRDRGPQLSPGFLDDDDETEAYAENSRATHARRFQDDLEAEDRAERRIINAKMQRPLSRERASRFVKDRRSAQASRRDLEEAMSEESERDISEYESEGLDDEEAEQEEIEDQEAEEEEVDEVQEEEEEQEEEDRKSEEEEHDERRQKRHEREESPMEESPPRKAVQRRRVVVSESDED
eukprot:TRINITY_DN2260_c0_g1_i2.p1 TRINITY_DN2260_c0_g1~~TRINITY_DN2260_c0_g1_i2.p1  ORF type:complete len:638 (+),score=203.68 TRINITY_DN2260_c0_g1_i2:366-2279(+)